MTKNASFAPRDGAGALVFRDRMWLLGGWNPKDKVYFPSICNNEVWSSTDGFNWVLEKPNTFGTPAFDPEIEWEGRHTAGYVVFKDKMWLVGGDANQGHYQNDIWNSSDGRRWNRVLERAPWGPRVLHHTFFFKDKIWVLGGQTLPQFATAPEKFYQDVWNSIDGIHWKQVEAQSPMWPMRGMIGGSAIFKNRIWILGGGTYDTPDTPQRDFYNDVWSSTDGIHWKKHIDRAPWRARQYHDVAVFDDRLWVLEGWNRENLNDVWYSPDGENWSEVHNTPWEPRHATSLYVYQDALWVVTGNNMESDVWKLQRIPQSP